MSDIRQVNYKEHWQEEEITLERPTNGDQSLGFAIAGGTDLPFLHDHFTSIIVINIHEEHPAHCDKRIRLYDIILSVDNNYFTKIKHKQAVDILRKAGRQVHLRIRRLSPMMREDIELEHNEKLGISIAGGIGHEYFSDDHGIFITNIAEHQTNNGLALGDRLLEISSGCNTYDLRFVTHEMAKQCIELACKERKTITLCVGHTRSTVEMQSERVVLDQDKNNLSVSQDKDLTQVEEAIYSVIFANDENRKTGYSNKTYEMIRTMSNQVDVGNSYEYKLKVSCERDGKYAQQYEERPPILKRCFLNNRSNNPRKVLFALETEETNVIKSTTTSTTVHMKLNHEVNNDVEELKV